MRFCFILIVTSFLFSGESEQCPYPDELSHQIDKRFTPKLYTRNHPDAYEIIPGHADNLHSSSFEPGDLTKVIIHGYLSSCDSKIFHIIKDAYLSRGDYNVICFDWSPLVGSTYTEAVGNLKIAGHTLGRVLDWLTFVSGSKASEDFHIIGHSLGAHVAGIAGVNLCHGPLQRITALDPAVPSISFSPGLSLVKGSANYVEAIFTSVLSNTHPFCHGNYIINGGMSQPECDHGEYFSPMVNVVCNHGRAYIFFADVISHRKSYSARTCRNKFEAMQVSCKREILKVTFDDVHFENFGIFSVRT